MIKMKQIGRVFVTCIITVLICIMLLFLSALIPKKAIQKTSESSATFFSKEILFRTVKENSMFTIQDNYADCILYNIMYHIDEKKPVISSIKASYYNEDYMNVNEGFEKSVYENAVSNNNYYRYWHGSMIFIRPLAVFFDIEGVRIILGLLAVFLSLGTAVLLWINKEKVLAIIYLISMGLIDIWMICLCLEYVSNFIIMNIITLIAICMSRKNHYKYETQKYKMMILFVISGIITSFMDFLTTETITFTIPLAVILIMLYHNSELKDYKNTMRIVFKSGIAWISGYAGMFLLKWVLSAAMFGMDAFLDSLQKAAVRVSGVVTNDGTNLGTELNGIERILGAWMRNLGCLLHVKSGTSYGVIIALTLLTIGIVGSLVYLFHQKKVEGKLYIPLFLLALLPYLRYFALSNHAYLHYFFTYRAQIITILVILFFLWENAIPGLWSLFSGRNKKRKKR